MKLSLSLIPFLISPWCVAELPNLGGDTTISMQGSAAFSQPAANLPLMQKVDFSVGNSFFRNPWVEAPASTTARDGLGPLFNTNGCQNCHIRDGRGHAPLNSEDSAVSMLMRLSIAPQSPEQQQWQQRNGPIGEPTYGVQLQDFAIQGVPAEGRIEVNWTVSIETLDDGSQVLLRQPDWQITQLGYGPLHPQTQMSARIAPQMIGLGLLEQISAADILANQDIDDANQDGISGKAQWVKDAITGEPVLGRFGWKAGMPTLEQQNSAAFNGDVGITSQLFEQDHCSNAQVKCQNSINGNTDQPYELQPEVIAAVTFYSRHIAVPRQRIKEPKLIEKGFDLFKKIGCESCHKSQFTTPKLPDLPALSQQVIHPFSDLLLHDLGDGLADHRPEYLANGNEWRTPPLWGLGLFAEVLGELALLHDGRARNIMEAVLWHGGEAEASKQVVLGFNQSQRDALVRFLESL